MTRLLLLALLLLSVASMGQTPGRLKSTYAPAGNTALVAGGKPDFVVCVAEGFYADLAAQVVRAVLGHDDPARIIPATATPPLDRTNVITLGCMAENPLLFRLYWNHYTTCDLITPGAGKGRVEVVVDPYPWCAGKNAIVLGGSDEAGVRAAVEHFLGRLKREGETCAYPWELFQTGAAKVDKAAVTPPAELSFNSFISMASTYVATTADAYAERAFEVLEKLYQEWAAGKRKDFTYADECTSPTTFYYWDVLEHHPSLTPDLRAHCQEVLYGLLLRGLPAHTYEWGELARGPLLVWNHTGCPLYGIYAGARYFSKHFPETRAEFTTDALQRCANAFTTQMKVWKPRENAHGYYRLAIETVMGYSAGEWNLEYIRSGNLARIADYAVDTGDNMGWAANFGDWEAIRSNACELWILDLAFAWLHDPGYLWRLNAISSHTWQNRYHRDVKPEPPTRLAGLQVVPMDPTIYNFFLTTDPHGGTIPPRPETPLEKSFDKIALRDDFDPLGQYMLLDGFSSGMHMHYDANMIVRYGARGRVFLMDDDYLMRQSTEHSGISLLRNGRNTQRMPLYASVEAAQDFGEVKLLRTRLPAYNDCDWTRNIIWRKGGFALVTDEVRPRQAQDALTVFNVLKLYDVGGVRVGEDGIMRSVHPAESPAMPEATFTVIPAEQRQAAIRRRMSAESDLPSARLIERALTDQGRPVTFRNLLVASDALHEAKLQMRGVGSGWVAIRGTVASRQVLPALSEGKTYSFDMPPADNYPDTADHVLTDGNHPSADNIKTGWVAWYMGSPTITLDLGAEQPVQTVGADVMGGNQWGIKFPAAVTLELAGEDGQFTPAGTFRPAWPETGERTVKQVVFEGLGRSVRRLRLHFEKAPGQAFVFVSEIWAAGKATLSEPVTRDLSCLAGSGKLSLPGLTVDADVAYLSPEGARFAGARQCQIGGVNLQPPASGELKWAELPGGGALARAVTEAIRSAFEGGQPGRFVMSGSETAQAPTFRWPQGEGVQMWPVGGDAPGLVVGAGNTVYRLDAAGKVLWQHALPAEVSAVGSGDLEGDGKVKVYAGTVGELLVCLDDTGREVWRWDVQPKLLDWAGWPGKARVEQIRIADLRGDGKHELLLGTKNSWLLCLSAARETLWKYGFIFHGCRDLQVVDLEGTGKPQVMAANRYGGCTRFDAATGALLAGYETELGDTFFACNPRPAPGTPAVVSGSTTGRFSAFDARGNVLWSFNNDGFGALTAAFAGGRVWLGSESGLLYVLDPRTGNATQTVDLGSAVLALLPEGDGVVAFDERGHVGRLDAAGHVTALANLGAKPLQVLPAPKGWWVLTPQALFRVSG